eukprot:scaffold468285_cov32-Prasinocladus_malaysianus.AAC.1
MVSLLERGKLHLAKLCYLRGCSVLSLLARIGTSLGGVFAYVDVHVMSITAHDVLNGLITGLSKDIDHDNDGGLCLYSQSKLLLPELLHFRASVSFQVNDHPQRHHSQRARQLSDRPASAE